MSADQVQLDYMAERWRRTPWYRRAWGYVTMRWVLWRAGVKL